MAPQLQPRIVRQTRHAIHLAPEQRRQPVPLPTDMPVTLNAFLFTLRGTDNEVWSHLIQVTHGRENHTVADWQAILASLRSAPG